MLGHLQRDNKLIIITGQTATGKTSLSLELKKRFNGELISFDSRQCYKYMDIITGKDIKQIYMYDEYDPKERINAFDYIKRADKYIKKILKSKKIPIIVGGAMFYIKSYLEGLQISENQIDWNKRTMLEKLSVNELQEKIKKIDNNILLKFNPSDIENKRRLIRAIERSQKSENSNKGIIKNKLPYIIISLVGDNVTIKNNIKKRILDRLESGAVKEVQDLLNKGYSIEDPGLKAMGYSHIIGYLNNKHILEKAIDLWLNAEYHYAKRQKVFLSQFKDNNILDINKGKIVEKSSNLVYKCLYYASEN